MSYGWVDPELFVRWKKVRVYHTYRYDDSGDPRMLHFTTDSTATEDNDQFSFDIRTFPKFKNPNSPKGKYLDCNKRKDQKIIIKKAIEAGLIKVPENI